MCFSVQQGLCTCANVVYCVYGLFLELDVDRVLRCEICLRLCVLVVNPNNLKPNGANGGLLTDFCVTKGNSIRTNEVEPEMRSKKIYSSTHVIVVTRRVQRFIKRFRLVIRYNGGATFQALWATCVRYGSMETKADQFNHWEGGCLYGCTNSWRGGRLFSGGLFFSGWGVSIQGGGIVCTWRK